MTAEEAVLDLEELRSLHSSSKRPTVRKWLEQRIEQLSSQLSTSTPVPTAEKVAAKADSSSAATSRPVVKVTNYGWDESDKYVKVYISLQGVHSVNPSNIQHSFTKNGYDVTVFDHGGKDYVMTMIGLRDEIVPENSQIKQKTDMLLVMMKKKSEGKKWEQLTKIEYDQKQKRKPKFDDKNDDPQASLMNMMKQMYDEGDDEMKRTIRKAWHEGQNKRNTADPPDFGDL